MLTEIFLNLTLKPFVGTSLHMNIRPEDYIKMKKVDQ